MNDGLKHKAEIDRLKQSGKMRIVGNYCCARQRVAVEPVHALHGHGQREKRMLRELWYLLR